MDVIEKIKLLFRANRYKNRTDKTEISYIINSIHEGETAIDIGAHKGGYLYNILKQIGPKGHLYAFEPQTILYNYLVSLKRIFKWSNVTIEHIALSDNVGSVKLFIPANKGKPTSPGASIVGSNNFREFKTEEVETDTLDRYCERNHIKPGFLKVDVEGNELNVFKGGAETLKKYRPKLIFECEERHVGKEKVLETFRFLEGLGYIGKFICGLDILPLSRFDFSVHQKQGAEPYCNNFIFE